MLLYSHVNNKNKISFDYCFFCTNVASTNKIATKNNGMYVKSSVRNKKCINHNINFTLLYHAQFLTKPCTVLTEFMVLIVCILNLAQVVKVFLYFANPTECTHVHVQ